MNVRGWKAVLAFLCVTAVIACAAYFRGKSRAEYDFTPTISIPESYEGTITLVHKDGSTSEHDGELLYSTHFLDGWSDCKRSFVDRVQWGDTKAWLYASTDDSDLEAPWIIGAPDEINDARRDGWRKCTQTIRELLEIHTEQSVRETLSSDKKSN